VVNAKLRNCGNAGFVISPWRLSDFRRWFVTPDRAIPFGCFARAGEYREQFSGFPEKPAPLFSVPEQSVL